MTTKSTPPGPPHPLHDYPREGMVPVDRLPLSFLAVFAQLYPDAARIFQAVSAANQCRKAADPDDPAVRTIERAEIPETGAAGAKAAWTNILQQACRGGARLVAALLLTAPADAFGAERDPFLKSLRQKDELLPRPQQLARPGAPPDDGGTLSRNFPAEPPSKVEIVGFSEEFEQEQESEALAKVANVTRALAGHGWSAYAVRTVDFCCVELIRNAFHHGLPDFDSGKVRIAIKSDVAFYFEMTARNPQVPFDLLSELARQGANDPQSQSCRGLALVYRSATSLYQTNPLSVKVILNRDIHPAYVDVSGPIVTFRFKGRLLEPHPYYWAQVKAEVAKTGTKVLVDLTELDFMSSTIVSLLLKLFQVGILPGVAPPAPRYRVAMAISEAAWELIELTALHRAFPIYRDLKDAVDYLMR